MGEAKRRKERLGEQYFTSNNQGKIWDKILCPIAFGFDGNIAFSEFDCVSSALTAVETGLADRINFGVVLVWDNNEKLWTPFYNWHCWAVTKQGQPFDLSVHYWEDIFKQTTPVPIVPEKHPFEMKCELIRRWDRDINDRNSTQADAVYLNGGFNTQHIHSLPDKLKRIIVLSGQHNGFSLSEAEKLVYS